MEGEEGRRRWRGEGFRGGGGGEGLEEVEEGRRSKRGEGVIGSGGDSKMIREIGWDMRERGLRIVDVRGC